MVPIYTLFSFPSRWKYDLHLNISFWEYSFVMNKHNQKPTDMFNKQDVTVYFIY